VIENQELSPDSATIQTIEDLSWMDNLSDEDLLEVEKLYGIDPAKQIFIDRYMGDDADTAFRFLTECWWTDNDADGVVELIPAKDYVGYFCQEWTDCYNARIPLITEKSRRMIISLISRGLETWTMGKSRGSWLVVDQTHENSAEHLYHAHFSLAQLKDRRPEVLTGTFDCRGAIAVKQPTHIMLSNGSIISQSHQEAGSAQGKGKTGTTLEEISKYRYPSSFWAQSLILTQGKGGSKGGWVNGICNASPNDDWRKIKCEESARKLLDLE
jgi:hypothetical protein